MAENPQMKFYKNVLTWRGSEKLYLDRETCDVFFVFNTKSDGCVKVPAHKCILSAISPAFRGMFFGPSKQDGDIEIVDSTPEAFKEFLQFFYRSSVELTAENIANVMNLGKQYLIDDCVKASAEFCEETLTRANLCWNYELAIFFNLNELKTQCEERIRESPKEFFASDGFLSCESNMLRHILRSDSLDCGASAIFDGLISWAKAECKRNGSNECDMANIRSQLNELFYEIPFDQMTHDEFQEHDHLNDGLFSLNEFKDISKMITNKNFKSSKFKRRNEESKMLKHCIESTELICYRTPNRDFFSDIPGPVESTIFRSSHPLLLTKITLGKHSNGRELLPVRIRITENPTSEWHSPLRTFVETTICSSVETDVELLSPVVVKEGIKYEIDIFGGVLLLKNRLEKEVCMERGITITFLSHSCYELVTRLNFSQATNHR